MGHFYGTTYANGMKFEWNHSGVGNETVFPCINTHHPLENGDYEGKRTQTVLFFRHLIGIIKLKGIILCFHVSTHITPLENGNYEG